jgi:hypothetical protein
MFEPGILCSCTASGACIAELTNLREIVPCTTPEQTGGISRCFFTRFYLDVHQCGLLLNRPLKPHGLNGSQLHPWDTLEHPEHHGEARIWYVFRMLCHGGRTRLSFDYCCVMMQGL